MEPFHQTKSIAKQLRATILLISAFFIFEIVGLYLSSQDALVSLAELRAIVNTTDAIRKSKQLTPIMRDAISRLSVPEANVEAYRVFQTVTGQAKQLLISANAPFIDLQVATLIGQSEDSLLQINMVSEQLNESRINLVESKGKMLIVDQLILEFIETLNKSEIILNSNSNTIINRLYENRFRPLILSLALGVIFLTFALGFGLDITNRIRRSIDNLLHTIQGITNGNLTLRAVIMEKDEIGFLTNAFNSMTESLQNSTVSKIHLEKANLSLAQSNKELETFSYSVSHDLRAPLRAIDGFSQALLEDFGPQLSEEGQRYLSRIRLATQRMAALIDDILKLSRISRADLNLQKVDLHEVANAVYADLIEREPKQRQVEMIIADSMTALADPVLIKIVFDNLIGNALKYTSKHPKAKIEIGQMTKDNENVFFIKDDGAGFDMAYAEKLFGAFQRLHRDSDFPGNGIGLATVMRIIHRHKGQIWAESEIEKGATFYFTLGSNAEK